MRSAWRSRRCSLSKVGKELDEQAVGQNHSQRYSKHYWLASVRLHKHIVMNHPADCGEISQPVQPVPSLPAELLDALLSRCQSQRHQHHEARHSHGDERTLGDVLADRFEPEKLVEPNVRQQVKAAVEKAVESEQAPELDHP